MSSCINAYTHSDLDGAVSLLTLIWALPNSHIKYKGFNNLQMDNLKTEVEEVNRPCTTFILDLALREEFLPDLDQEHITFIDHHETSESFIPRFQRAKIIHKTISSNALLMAKLFKGEKYPDRTNDQKMLIALADDFDCYRLQIPESYDLNILFWTMYKNNFTKFINDYREGFKPFTPEQKRAISFVKKAAQEEAKSLPIFTGDVNFGSKKKRVVAALTEKISNTVMDMIMQAHQPDIFFFVNTKTEKVCIRQFLKNDPIDVGAFAEKICDGGGHSNAGGGVITPLFMEITKNLKPLNG
jgi:nanoRNase/pAp phosphatase (c-di-AMP/oligoRNAs hydrolase)